MDIERSALCTLGAFRKEEGLQCPTKNAGMKFGAKRCPRMSDAGRAEEIGVSPARYRSRLKKLSHPPLTSAVPVFHEWIGAARAFMTPTRSRRQSSHPPHFDTAATA
jgi:hypothetical protein